MKKRIKLALALMLCTTLSSSCNAANNSVNSNTKSYTSSSETFNNPDRGFYVSASTNNQDSPLSLDYMQSLKAKNMTQVRRIYVISAYRNSDLPKSFIDFVAKDFETARKAGVRLIVRFAYNWEWEGYDASSSRIVSHLDQLKSVLTDNKDAISFMEAGFLGSWGEWHHSKNNLENSEDRRKILFKILSILPADRMVALRYPRDKMEIFNSSSPLTPEQAFNGSYQARTGAHNDCFVASNSDLNTYDWSDPNIREKEKSYLNLDNRYVPQGGETCQTSEYDDCPNTLKEIARMRWSTINSEYEQNVLKGWQDQGCMNEIGRRLGYRFRLISSTTAKSVRPGGTFAMSFKVANDGWGSSYNYRMLEVVLRNSQTGKEYFFHVNEDVRKWLPGETKEVNISAGIPSNIPTGQYQVFLNLPDPSSRLYFRPEYRVRLANKDVWEPSTGYNSLQQTVSVDTNAGGGSYSGSQVFNPR
jgi:hypothetical protein